MSEIETEQTTCLSDNGEKASFYLSNSHCTRERRTKILNELSIVQLESIVVVFFYFFENTMCPPHGIFCEYSNSEYSNMSTQCGQRVCELMYVVHVVRVYEP
jgi:hypothetical protein